MIDLRMAMERLPESEIAYAQFNALRTGDGPEATGISRVNTPALVCLTDSTCPTNSYYNRAFTRSPEALSAEALAELPQGVIAIETQPADLTPESSARLLGHGFTPQSQLCYLAALPSAGQTPDVTVTRLGSLQVNEFFDLLQQQGVDFPLDKRAQKREYYCSEQFQAYVARTDDGTVCGWATLFVGDGSVFLGNCYTLPEFRRLGAHRALVQARLRAAAAMGVEVAYTDVEPQTQSHYNCEREGFRTLTVTTLWVKPI